MRLPEKWIWLDPQKYPAAQNTRYSGCQHDVDCNYTVAEFTKQYRFGKKIRQLDLRFSGDTAFQLYLNGSIVATGPVPAGGDFLCNDFPRGQHYASELTLYPNTDALEFFVQVKMAPVELFEYSQGHGGFMLSGLATFEDDTCTVLTTDRSWLARKNAAFAAPHVYDASLSADAYAPACQTPNIWHARTAPLPLLSEQIISCGEIIVKAGETAEREIELDRIYAAVLGFTVQTNGLLTMEAASFETQTDPTELREHLTFTADDEYRGFAIHSVGGLRLKITNHSARPALILPKIIARCYPAQKCAITKTSDEELNTVLDVCAHTLKYCRQHIHLDSPRHCEPLACTGDYYIESLMTAFSFGDMALAEFDVLRTAELLRQNDGRMFHTTYSLIWVQMLYDTYQFTGRQALLESCADALILLLERFDTYIGKNGLIETPPDYMFIDWLYIDGISLHHPPKALGQTCLNLFCFGALKTAAKIFALLDNAPMAELCRHRAEMLKTAVNSLLFNRERQMYFEGLNTPTPEHLICDMMPQNVSKRYYRKHANILAAYFGICEPELAQSLLHRIMSDEIEGDYQPYFAHFLLEAVYRNGLREEYTRPILEKWKAPVRECAKGLAEGFIPPEPTYKFDHSHAWGGTPLYALPLALTGLKILEPGMKKLQFSPSLLGMERAAVEVPTPYGTVVLKMEAGKEPFIDHPEEITTSIR